MKTKYINPFISASLNLFRGYLEVKCESGKPYLNKEPQNLNEISGLIGLAGETQGAIVLSFTRETAIGMASKMVGRPYIGMTNEVLDVIGEFANIIAGNAKKDLMDFRIAISLPGVIVGKSTSIRWPEGIPVITIPFVSELGEFSLSVSLRS